MASYHLHDAALSDLDSIYEYGILTFGLKQANSYYDGLVLHFQTVANNPLAYIRISHIRSNYHRATYYSHSIYYRIKETHIVIVRILGQQDFHKALDTL